MMENKVRGEQHIQLGYTEEVYDEKEANEFSDGKKLPYGEASKQAPDVTVEE